MTSSNLKSLRFHLYYAWFNFREQFSDIPSSLLANILVPFFIWLLSYIWQHFNGAQGNFTLHEVIIYIGITELLFMTFVRQQSVNRASGDFSVALARPRSWPISSFSGLVGRSLGGRIIMLFTITTTYIILGVNLNEAWDALFRLVLLLPILSLLQGLFALFFATAQVLWHQTDYFLLPFGKIFLVLGGVWAPLVDFAEPWRGWFVHLPPADLFFQPAYFCIKGHFYLISIYTWIFKLLTLALILIVINIYFYRTARRRHRAYGG